VDWLRDRLTSPAAPHEHGPIVIDCRFQLNDPAWGDREFAAARIPTAQRLDLDRHLAAPPTATLGRHPLPDLDHLVHTLNNLGIASATATTPATPVILYDNARFAYAARAWWLLRYLGHEAVALLDGGWAAWQAAGAPIETGPPRSPQPLPSPSPAAPTTANPAPQFIPNPHTDWVAAIETVAAASDRGTPLLLDAREVQRFRGEAEPIDPIAGAIPKAVNHPWQQVTDEQGLARSPAALQAQLAAVGLTAATAPTAIAYCGSGVTACVNLWAMAWAGLPLARLYVGSWSQWCAHHPDRVARSSSCL
jgi:thiosulfate/3-mercaptopyruvate sulfurtransferase